MRVKFITTLALLLAVSVFSYAADGDLIVSGNLGIGTPTPAHRVDVNGTVRANGYVTGNTAGQSGTLTVSPVNNCGTAYYLSYSNGLVTGSGSYYETSGCGSCLRSGTSILLANGSVKSIEDIGVNDELLGENESKNKVLDLDRHPLGKRKFYSINNGPFFVTEDHPFMTTTGWKSINPALTSASTKMQVGKLVVGDTLVTKSGPVKVDSLASQDSPSDTVVYNFILNGTKSYYANGVLVRAYNDLKR